MVVGSNEIFDEMGKYLKRNYKNLVDFEMPYCSLQVGLDGCKVYRVQVNLRLRGSRAGMRNSKSAIAEVDPTTGKILKFKDGYTWQFWV